jgi:hypothetical protein
VSQEEAKKAKIPYKKPTITDLGLWSEGGEEKLRERALAQGMPLEEIESLLDKIREARKRDHKTTDAA